MNCLVLTDDFPNRLEPWRGPYHRRQFECLSRLCGVSVVDPIPWTRLLSDRRLFGLAGKPDNVLAGISVCHPLFWYLPVAGRNSHWKRLLASAKKGLSELGEKKYDVVLATFAYPHGLAAKNLAREMKVPYVVKVRGTDLHSLPARGSKAALTAAALRDADAVVAVSRNLAQISIGLGAAPERIRIIPNGVDAGSFPVIPREEARKKSGLAAGGKFILFVGRLLPIKGIDLLMEAFCLLKKDPGNREVTLLIAGQGPLRNDVVNRAGSEGITASIRLMGHVSREEVSNLMNAADSVVLPSRNEGCPNVVLEALCCGTPPVAFRVGAVPDLINDESGIIVPAGDVKKMAEGIESALARKWDRAAIRRRVEGMSWEKNAAALYAALEDAVRRRGKEARAG